MWSIDGSVSIGFFPRKVEAEEVHPTATLEVLTVMLPDGCYTDRWPPPTPAASPTSTPGCSTSAPICTDSISNRSRCVTG